MILKFKEFFAIFLVEPFDSFALNCAWSRRFVLLHINYQTLLYYTPRYSKRPLVCKGMLIDVGVAFRRLNFRRESVLRKIVGHGNVNFTFRYIPCIKLLNSWKKLSFSAVLRPECGAYTPTTLIRSGTVSKVKAISLPFTFFAVRLHCFIRWLKPALLLVFQRLSGIISDGLGLPTSRIRKYDEKKYHSCRFLANGFTEDCICRILS